MSKKLFLLVSIIFAILCISSITFANNDLSNNINNIGNNAKNGVMDLRNDVSSGIGAVENTVEGAFNDVTNDDNIRTQPNNGGMTSTDGAYSTVRTSADLTANDGGLTADLTWVWIALIIAAIVIIGLVWYYGTQNNTDR